MVAQGNPGARREPCGAGFVGRAPSGRMVDDVGWCQMGIVAARAPSRPRSRPAGAAAGAAPDGARSLPSARSGSRFDAVPRGSRGFREVPRGQRYSTEARTRYSTVARYSIPVQRYSFVLSPRYCMTCALLKVETNALKPRETHGGRVVTSAVAPRLRVSTHPRPSEPRERATLRCPCDSDGTHRVQFVKGAVQRFSKCKQRTDTRTYRSSFERQDVFCRAFNHSSKFYSR